MVKQFIVTKLILYEYCSVDVINQYEQTSNNIDFKQSCYKTISGLFVQYFSVVIP